MTKKWKEELELDIKDGTITYFDKQDKVIYFYSFSLKLLSLSDKKIFLSRIIDVIDLKNINYERVQMKLTSFVFKRKDKKLEGGKFEINCNKETLEEDITFFLSSYAQPFIKD